MGLPYQWGGTGPNAYDCSGLVQMAYASAGISIARTSQAQWATEAHVSTPAPGDLVFFAGADGTDTSPGHVGIVTGPHTMIEAYGTGYPIRYSQFGTSASPPGDGSPVGFTDPAAHAGVS
jgi:peptidoglycan DL-endopeptidase CwlO